MHIQAIWSASMSDKLLRQVNAEQIASVLSPGTERGSHRSAAAWDAELTAGLSEGCEAEGLQAQGRRG